MDIKKSSKATLEDKKDIFLLIGFTLVLSLFYIALEWRSYEATVYEISDTDFLVESELDIIPTNQNQPSPLPPPPAPVLKVAETLKIVDNNTATVPFEVNSEDEKNKIVELSDASIPVPIEVEDDQVVFQVVEIMPLFPGGDAQLYKFLGSNLKYPIIALEKRKQGRVVCQFIVNKDGSISNIEIVGSLDTTLDNEALRVIRMMPKWSPGIRHSKAVRVKYTLAVNFNLQN